MRNLRVTNMHATSHVHERLRETERTNSGLTAQIEALLESLRIAGLTENHLTNLNARLEATVQELNQTEQNSKTHINKLEFKISEYEKRNEQLRVLLAQQRSELTQQIDQKQQRVLELKGRLSAQKNRTHKLEAEQKALKESTSWRIGKALTWPVRAVTRTTKSNKK